VLLRTCEALATEYYMKLSIGFECLTKLMGLDISRRKRGRGSSSQRNLTISTHGNQITARSTNQSDLYYIFARDGN